MNGKAVSGIMLTLLLTGMLTLAFNIQPAKAEPITWTVDDDGRADFHITQEDINAENPEDTICMHAALHHDLNSSDNLEPEFVPGEVILKFESNISIGHVKTTVTTGIRSVDELNKRFEVTEIRRVLGNVCKLELPEDADVVSISREYEADSNVEYAEPNYVFNTCVVPNDANYMLQWAHQVIQSELAWDIEKGDPRIVIAVVDTGVDWTHPDLAANIWINRDEAVDGIDNDGNGFVDDVRGWDFVDNDNDPMEISESSFCHGTHCAGIAAAVTNNGIGIAGVCWNCKIMAVRVGYGYFISLDYAVKGIKYAVDNGADIISMSWGLYEDPWTLREAIKYAYDKGVLLVAAAGNEATTTKLYPAAYDEVVAVTATDQSDKPSLFTNFGEWVEVSAPGVQIYSTWLNGSYGYLSGTSMSAPLVAGVAALIWSRFPNMTRDRVRLQLRHTADDLGDLGFDKYHGYGRVNARKAVEPRDHDLLISDWERTSYVEAGDVATVTTTVFNLGSSNESDITVQLLVNGSVVDNAAIDFLASYESATVSCSWTPATKGIYNVTSYVVPVDNETVIENNAVSGYVFVGIKIIRVPAYSPIIQEAVDAAGPGFIILVSAGKYHENVIVNKEVSLVGENRDTTIIDANGTGTAVSVRANNVNITNFTISNGIYGVYLYNVRGCNISNCYVTNNSWGGILVSGSSNNRISENNIKNNWEGIYLGSSSGNSIVGNNVTENSYGIDLYDSSDNMLRGNRMAGNVRNFGVWGEKYFIQDVDVSNTVDGKPIYYWINKQDMVVPLDGGYVALVNCANITVQNLNLTKNRQGLLLAATTNSTITQNNITANGENGVELYESSTNRIVGNNLTNNGRFGIYLYESSNNTISGNEITATYGYTDSKGILLEKSSNNTIDKNIVAENGDGGILLAGSSNNMISANNITDNWGLPAWDYGIELTYLSIWEGYWPTIYSENNTIIGNNITKNSDGIRLERSFYNTIMTNTIRDNGYYGILMEGSYQNILRGNNLAGNQYNVAVFSAFADFQASISDFIQNIDTSNTVNGKPVYYLVNQSNLIIDASDIGYLALINCTNVHVSGATLKNNGQGVLLAFTTNSTIERATIAHNRVGIHILNSDANTLDANNITDNSYGISLHHASFNNITKNTITNNHEYYGGGIVLGWLVGWGGIGSSFLSEHNIIISNMISNNSAGIYIITEGITRNTITGNTIKNNVAGIYITYNASNNRIYHNNFIDNKKQVDIDTEHGTAVNTWDNGYPSGGNYWSDYNGTDLYGGSYQNLTGSDGIGDSPYIIDENNQDNYPLMKPRLRITGDLNNDGTVNIYDVVLIASIYGSREGDPNWNPDADLAPPYGVIDIYDIVTCVSCFGKQT